MASNQTELRTLKKLITQANHILDTTPALPQNRTAACQELLQSALALTNDLLSQAKTSGISVRTQGGSATARRHGPEHYRQMAAKRKIFTAAADPAKNRVVFINKSAIYRT